MTHKTSNATGNAANVSMETTEEEFINRTIPRIMSSLDPNTNSVEYIDDDDNIHSSFSDLLQHAQYYNLNTSVNGTHDDDMNAHTAGTNTNGTSGIGNSVVTATPTTLANNQLFFRLALKDRDTIDSATGSPLVRVSKKKITENDSNSVSISNNGSSSNHLPLPIVPNHTSNTHTNSNSNSTNYYSNATTNSTNTNGNGATIPIKTVNTTNTYTTIAHNNQPATTTATVTNTTTAPTTTTAATTNTATATAKPFLSPTSYFASKSGYLGTLSGSKQRPTFGSPVTAITANNQQNMIQSPIVNNSNYSAMKNNTNTANTATTTTSTSTVTNTNTNNNNNVPFSVLMSPIVPMQTPIKNYDTNTNMNSNSNSNSHSNNMIAQVNFDSATNSAMNSASNSTTTTPLKHKTPLSHKYASHSNHSNNILYNTDDNTTGSGTGTNNTISHTNSNSNQSAILPTLITSTDHHTLILSSPYFPTLHRMIHFQPIITTGNNSINEEQLQELFHTYIYTLMNSSASTTNDNNSNTVGELTRFDHYSLKKTSLQAQNTITSNSSYKYSTALIYNLSHISSTEQYYTLLHDTTWKQLFSTIFQSVIDSTIPIEYVELRPVIATK